MSARAWLGMAAVLVAGAVHAEAPLDHQLSVSCVTSAAAYLSDARTLAGFGGGLGVRDTIQGRYLVQANVAYLLGLGNLLEVSVGAGVQRQGLWSPAALVTLSAYVGQGYSFYTPDHPAPVRGPALALGLSVAPLRFQVGAAQISLLQLGAGIGSDFPGLAFVLRATAVEVSAAF